MGADPTVPLYLDFISPYSWLALMRAESFANEHCIRWEPRPIVYAALLDTHDLVGPVETPAKRRYTFQDVARTARHHGLRFEGPPTHPFRSLEALRTQYLFRDDPSALRLAVRLSDICWGEGRPLTDDGVVAEAVVSVGLDATDLASRTAEARVKDGLREQTEAALRLGVFGVPTFVHDGELFWGHDRMEHLARRVSGEAPPAADLAASFLARPQGVQRKRAPRVTDPQSGSEPV